jgi:hypothetical protein
MQVNEGGDGGRAMWVVKWFDGDENSMPPKNFTSLEVQRSTAKLHSNPSTYSTTFSPSVEDQTRAILTDSDWVYERFNKTSQFPRNPSLYVIKKLVQSFAGTKTLSFLAFGQYENDG